MNNSFNQLHSLLSHEPSEDPDKTSPREHPLWNLAVNMAVILDPEKAYAGEIDESFVKSLIPAIETYSKDLDFHFKDENRHRVILYSTLASKFATLAGKYSEGCISASDKYLRMSERCHKLANQAAKDAGNRNIHLANYSLRKKHIKQEQACETYEY